MQLKHFQGSKSLTLEPSLSSSIITSHSDSKIPICLALSLATAALLGGSIAHAEDAPWRVDAAGLFYSESDSRVSLFEPVVHAQKEYAGSKILSLNLVLDTLTGATPSGALPSDEVQTFTRPSGNGSYQVAPGELPLDDTFKDTRVAFSGNWQQPLSELTTGSVGANISKEYDFTSLGVNAGLARDFNQRNTTVNFGFGFEADMINPEGGVPIPYAAMQPTTGIQPRIDDSDDKNIVDALIGITQVINRRTLMQFNYSISQSSGYLTDPFKILSVVEDGTGDVVDTDPYRFENRPDTRVKNALFWRVKYSLDRDVVDLSYRYLWDDWDIKSHTIEARYRWNFTPRQYLEPHIRYYQQSAAEFYRPLLLESDVDNGTLPEYASADLRLGEFTAFTVGAKYGHKVGKNSEWNVRLESYQQQGDSHPEGTFGSNALQDVSPGLDALIVQAGYSFDW